MPTWMQRSLAGRRRCRLRSTSACDVSWQRAKRSATFKKGAWLLRSRPQVKYGFIAKYRTIWPTRAMYRLLCVSNSGFHDWLDRPASAHEPEDSQLLKAAKHSHEASDGTYGSPRVGRDLNDAGFSYSETRVTRSGTLPLTWQLLTVGPSSARVTLAITPLLLILQKQYSIVYLNNRNYLNDGLRNATPHQLPAHNTWTATHSSFCLPFMLNFTAKQENLPETQ